MAMENKLELKLSQKLVLTPQLQQSIKLLQLQRLELSNTLNQELMENPLLEEIVERDSGDRDEETPDISRAEESPGELPEDPEAPLEKIFGFNAGEYFDERGSDGRDLGYFTSGTELETPFDTNTKKTNLYEYLLWQLRLSRTTDPVRQAAEFIIGNLNEDGYLQVSPDEISAMTRFDIKTVEEAVEHIKGFDPPGVGARTLQECLRLQLGFLNLGNTLVDRILADGFTELEKKKYRALAVKFGVQMDEILAAVRIIEGLEPRPGRNYSGDDPVHIIPDVYVYEGVDGNFTIVLNDEGIPRLRLSGYYRKLLANKKALEQETKQFLEERLRSAVWLLKSLDQRNRTIYRVTESILKFQDDFFRHGRQYLKPLNLKDVAEDLGMHESTISRVTSNKYIQCPQGLFGFRFFFSSALHSGNGEISSSIVKETIKQLISGEDTKVPLSDKDIVEKLKGRNIGIARRTVAKYREEMRIPSHTRRKKWV